LMLLMSGKGLLIVVTYWSVELVSVS
jgi:hypothetical protein